MEQLFGLVNIGWKVWEQFNERNLDDFEVFVEVFNKAIFAQHLRIAEFAICVEHL